MHSTASLRRLLFTIGLIGLLAGCGGGGGGGDDNSGSGSGSGVSGTDPTNATIPHDPPALTPAVYSGATNPATVDEQTAAALTSEAWIILQTVVPLAYGTETSLPPSTQTINETDPGPAGGQSTVMGRVRSNGSGWLSIDYDNYQYQPDSTTDVYTYDGSVQLLYNWPGSEKVLVAMSPLSITGPNLNQTVTGTIELTKVVKNAESVPHYVGNLVLTDHIVGGSLKAENYVVEGDTDQAVTGRLYDSRLGYVDVSTTEPLHYDSADGSEPPSGGPLVVSGAGSSDAQFAFLNRALGSIGIDADGDGAVEEATRLDWQTGFLDTTPTSYGLPQAQALVGSAEQGKPVKIDGRYSHASDGNYIHFTWTLAAAPAGSSAVLQNTQAATATLTPDVPGDYLVRLVASNATGFSSDAVVVNMPEQDYDRVRGTGSPEGPDRNAPLNKPVTLDARAAGDPSYNWILYTPPGSQAALDDPTAARPTFTPDVAGYYFARHSRAGFGAPVVVVSVDAPLHFDRAVTIQNLAFARKLAVGDLNSDGLPDIAVGGSISNDGQGATVVVYNLGNGRFSAPVEIAAGYYGGTNEESVAIGDINDDGRADLVVLAPGGIDYLLQQSDGTLGPIVLVPDGGAACAGIDDLSIAPLFGDPVPSVLTTGSYCYGKASIFRPVPGGTFDLVSSIVFPGTMPENILAADLTGDGIADLVSDNWTTPHAMLVEPGRADGTFGTTQVYPLSQQPTGMSVGDLNDDARPDVVALHENALDVFFQQTDGSLGTQRTLSAANSVQTLTIADIDGDGLNDLVTTGSYMNGADGSTHDTLGLFPQRDALASEYIYPVTSGSEATAVADMNGDGMADIVSLSVGRLQLMLADPLNPGKRASQSLQLAPRSQTRRPAILGGRPGRVAPLHVSGWR